MVDYLREWFPRILNISLGATPNYTQVSLLNEKVDSVTSGSEQRLFSGYEIRLNYCYTINCIDFLTHYIMATPGYITFYIESANDWSI